MRSYFLDYKIENYRNILHQIKDLNKKVIRWCADKVYSNLLQYKIYIKDISTMPQYMTRPLNMSVKGSNIYDLTARNDMRG